MVIVGHNDIECCFLMPDENKISGVLSDDYYKTLIKQHSVKVNRRRYKLIRYLMEGFEVFQKSCEKLINLGIMDRLFHDFDFFSINDRDLNSPGAQQRKKQKEKPSTAKAKTDIFGDIEYAFDSDLSALDSDTSDIDQQTQDR